MTKIIGQHTLRSASTRCSRKRTKKAISGARIADLQLQLRATSASGTGNAFADFLIGRHREVPAMQNQLKFYNRYRIVEPYFQDDWRITDRLTLNLGLRVSLFGTYRERYQHPYNFEPASFSPPPMLRPGSTPGSVPGRNLYRETRSTAWCSAAERWNLTLLVSRFRHRYVATPAAWAGICSIPAPESVSLGIRGVTARPRFAAGMESSSSTLTATKPTPRPWKATAPLVQNPTQFNVAGRRRHLPGHPRLPASTGELPLSPIRNSQDDLALRPAVELGPPT